MPEAAGSGATRRRRRRGRGGRGRGGGRGGGGGVKPLDAASPRSSEDIFRVERPEHRSVGAPHDGRTLEGVIGELQSIWGVPQSPQEFRITLKVAEERESAGGRVAAIDEVKEDPPSAEVNGAPRREKAPGAPRIGAPGVEADGAVPARRKRSRRRRRRR